MQKSGDALFLLMSNEEHLLSIELHKDEFIVLTVESDTNKHLHNIMLDTFDPTPAFNINGLLDTIWNTPCESIRENLKTIKWTEEDGSALSAVTLHQRLTRVQVFLVTLMSKEMARERVPMNINPDLSNSATRGSSRTPISEYQTLTTANLKQGTRKSTSGDTDSLWKKTRRGTPATTSGSALTNITTGSKGSEHIIDYQKAAKT